MTDLDGKNLLSIDSRLTELTYFMNYGLQTHIQGRFMWSAQSRVSEFENRMPMRSRALVSDFTVLITANASTMPTLFSIRRSKIASVGVNVLTDETLDAVQLTQTAGQTGLFTSPDVLQYEIDDYICFKYREIEPNFSLECRIQCKIDFEAN